MPNTPKWLEDAVFYEIYPQSFCDSNGDGIGDFQGIIKKLGYIKSLGCNALWINSFYDSAFMDGGYDVIDFMKVAPRLGTNEDMKQLLDTAHSKGIKVLLDFVPGHTSDKHPWFLESKKAQKNEYTNRFIYTNSVWDAPPEYRMMCGLCERDGNYMVNYFSSQPALNYGFYDVKYPDWQLPYDHPDCKKTMEAMKDIMRFWLDMGADGFRVDMADSLVKNDDEKIATAQIWKDVRQMLDKDYPNAAMVAEWSCPERAINDAGLHMDFYLDHRGNGYSTLFRYEEDGQNKSFFCKDGNGDVTKFAEEFSKNYELTKNSGYISIFTCCHDNPRLTKTLDNRAIMLAYATIFTLPGVPFLYYGDEIGMRYLEGLTSKEGGYSRTGSRTPMQWDSSKNLGFSTADSNNLYLPVDSSKDAPTVENQMKKADSIFTVVKDILKLRHTIKDLGNTGDFKVIYAEKNKYPFVYKRGNYVIFVNPKAKKTAIDFDEKIKKVVYSIGDGCYENKQMIMHEQSFCIVELEK